MPKCSLEHERDFRKDEAGYRHGARDVHSAGAMGCKNETKTKRRKSEMGMMCSQRQTPQKILFQEMCRPVLGFFLKAVVMDYYLMANLGISLR